MSWSRRAKSVGSTARSSSSASRSFSSLATSHPGLEPDLARTCGPQQEISPFPYAALSAALDPFRKTARSLIWAQDEPSNAGAYTFVAPRVQQVLPRGAKLRYVGREAMATVAPGVKSYFEEGRKRIEDDVFEGL